MYGRLRNLLGGFEGVEPGEGKGVDVGGVGGYGEAGLDGGEGAVVGEEEIATEIEGGGFDGFFEVEAEPADGAEVVLCLLGLALAVGESDVVA